MMPKGSSTANRRVPLKQLDNNAKENVVSTPLTIEAISKAVKLPVTNATVKVNTFFLYVSYHITFHATAEVNGLFRQGGGLNKCNRRGGTKSIHYNECAGME